MPKSLNDITGDINPSYLKKKKPNIHEFTCQCKMARFKKKNGMITITAKDLKGFVLGEVEYLHSIGLVTWDVKRDFRSRINRSFKENCTPLVKVR